MREILGKAKTVRKSLKRREIFLDYFQREYKWHEKQIRELVNDFWNPADWVTGGRYDR